MISAVGCTYGGTSIVRFRDDYVPWKQDAARGQPLKPDGGYRLYAIVALHPRPTRGEVSIKQNPRRTCCFSELPVQSEERSE
ncbi:hypothetical protein C0Q70_17925 [Pomacea canaliculata]|uniref:Uncharacterized protein n=1 Tax=Pomacea canaliculata TaxID=400727 RepID=A0A2T7NLT3_POMCA|nr:hypothetical protein C0Q70_17925 [Pomacea canaliculata]